MESLANLTYRHQIHLPLNLRHHRPSLCKPISSLSFPTQPSSPFLKLPSLRTPPFPSPLQASSFSNNHISPNPTTQTPLLRISLIAAVTAAAIFLSQFNFKPAFAAPVAPPPSATVESEATAEAEIDPELEIRLQEGVDSKPNDVEAIKTLMQYKMKSKKFDEAIELVDRLLCLERENAEWPVLKAYMLSYSGDHASAKKAFNAIILDDPFRVEAYHGLVMVASQLESPRDLFKAEKLVLEGLNKSKKEKKWKEGRELYVLLAQILVIRGDYKEALDVYKDLIRSEPRDFRPYLCKGIIYTLLKNDALAEENYDMYRRLVPKEHPYMKFFEENMNAAKIFVQKEEKEQEEKERSKLKFSERGEVVSKADGSLRGGEKVGVHV